MIDYDRSRFCETRCPLFATVRFVFPNFLMGESAGGNFERERNRFHPARNASFLICETSSKRNRATIGEIESRFENVYTAKRV